MCVPGCLEVVERQLSRRKMISSLGLVAGAAIAAPETTAHADQPRRVRPRAGITSFRRVLDLTHTYSEDFTHWRGGGSVVELKTMASTDGGDDWNVFEWRLDEHAGTHIDAPFHRNPAGLTVDQIPVEDLVLPLAVIDIQGRARDDNDAQVTIKDVMDWESRYGKLPNDCCVAMNSGWDRHVYSDKFINFDEDQVRHFPGFHVDTAEFLLEQRNVTAIAVDTASLDQGSTSDFPVHVAWLGANRWGLENVANLSSVPAWGATIVVGAPKIKGASGGPTRVMTLA